MAKDPAFLFYSTDFYEGTRTMLPEERACLIDLLIYQHQHGEIPDDPKRLTMYCSGCSEETIKIVLNSKFKQTLNGTLNGWSNEKLSNLVGERSKGRPKKIATAAFGGLISSNNLSPEHKSSLRKAFNIDHFIFDNEGLPLNDSLIKQRVRKWFDQMLNQTVNGQLTINEDEDEDEDIYTNTTKHVINKKEKEKETLPPIEKSEKQKRGEKVDEAFRLFWDKYHQVTRKLKTDTKAAKNVWAKMSLDERLIAFENIEPFYKSSEKKENGRFIIKAKNYLSDKRFNDEFTNPAPTPTRRKIRIPL